MKVSHSAVPLRCLMNVTVTQPADCCMSADTHQPMNLAVKINSVPLKSEKLKSISGSIGMKLFKVFWKKKKNWRHR